MKISSSEIIKKRVKSFFNVSSYPILIDRAFIGLYSTFLLLGKNTTKRKVLISSNTCAAPIYACMYAGFTPVFVDIKLDNCLMDVNEIKKLIDSSKDEVAAVLYIYLYGHISDDINEIATLAKKNDMFLIEDAAQAFGASINGKLAGSFGDVSIFSFGRTKQIDAGAGGFIINNSNKLKSSELQKIIDKAPKFGVSKELISDYRNTFYKLRKDGLEGKSELNKFKEFYYKYKALYFNDLKVDWSLCLEKFDEFITKKELISRTEISKKYEHFFRECKFDFLHSWMEINEGYSVYRYSVFADCYETSSELSEFLRSKDIHCSNLYLPFGRIYNDEGYENSFFAAKTIINLWVDRSIVNDDYMKKTFKAFKEYNGINKVKRSE